MSLIAELTLDVKADDWSSKFCNSAAKMRCLITELYYPCIAVLADKVLC